MTKGVSEPARYARDENFPPTSIRQHLQSLMQMHSPEQLIGQHGPGI